MYMQAPERFAGASFDPKGKGASKTLVGMRMSHTMDTMMFGINDADYGMINLLNKLENGDPEVKWDEETFYEPFAVEEPVLVSKTLEKMERRSVRDSKAKEAVRAAEMLKDQDFSSGMGTPKTSDLIKACSVYEEKRKPRTDLGKQRKEMVHTIRENALREMDIFHTNSREYFESRKGGTFGDVIGDFQRTQAVMNGQL